MIEEFTDAQRRSWEDNAEAWTRAVREGQIESRRLVTDAAILAALRARAPRRVLDLGCGEGWLCRALAEAGVEAVGVDASAALIEAARRQGGRYFQLAYSELTAAAPLLGAPFDAVVCNFSLLEEALAPVLCAAAGMLTPNGALLIQTVHPWSMSAEGDYRSGWRVEQFQDFPGCFPRAMPWFFHTLEDWGAQLAGAGLTVTDLCEPLHPQTGRPASLLFVCSPRSSDGSG